MYCCSRVNSIFLGQAIIWTNDGLLLIEPFGTYFIEIWIKIQFSLMKIHLKKSGKCWPSCLGLNMLKQFSMFHRCSQVLYKSFEKCELCQVVLYGILSAWLCFPNKNLIPTPELFDPWWVVPHGIKGAWSTLVEIMTWCRQAQTIT